jgi:ubiquitin carboxyl-terminal hydrolase 10
MLPQVMKWVDFSVDLEIGCDLLSATSKTRYTLKQRQYKLFAVVCHNGLEATKGHYVTDAYHTGELRYFLPLATYVIYGKYAKDEEKKAKI